MNSAKRAGFDFNTHFNDFTNEGHMYPVHGVGDLDHSTELLHRFIQSTQGEAFDIVDLGLKIQVDDDTGLPIDNAYIDFHVIPTKHLDGSTRMPSGKRAEDYIKYFNPKIIFEDAILPKERGSIDWISGMAKFNKGEFGDVPEYVPTTLSSTRVTPYLDQDEYLGLTFFSDGPQTRVNNGGKVTNWRYVVPGYDTDIVWFVAQAYVPCDAKEQSEGKCTMMKTTSGGSIHGRPRTANETNDVSLLQGKNNLMKTVSKHTVKIKNGYDRSSSFNQRYGNKQADYGDIMMKSFDQSDVDVACGLPESTNCMAMRIYQKWVLDRPIANKQIAFYEICDMYTTHLFEEGVANDGPNSKSLSGTQQTKFNEMKTLLNDQWFNISPESLNTKCLGAKAYLPTPLGETGWMVVEPPDALEVPDEPGEFFIGWSVLNQPSNRLHVADPDGLNWAVSHGYKIHQGPGILYITGGTQSHPGNLEPFLLEHDYFDYTTVSGREKAAHLPNVHWRLDAPDVIRRSLDEGAVTETNVGATQKMLASIGTQTSLYAPSRSPNFLGRFYQKLLSQPHLLKDLKKCAAWKEGKRSEPSFGTGTDDLHQIPNCDEFDSGNEVYRIVGGDDAYVYSKPDLEGSWNCHGSGDSCWGNHMTYGM
jgi:hypothetical protein